MGMKIKNYYKILGVESSATSQEIRSAYKRLVTKYHPDKHPDDKKIAKVFAEISEAYDILGNIDKRLNYNLLLNRSRRLMDDIALRDYKRRKKK